MKILSAAAAGLMLSLTTLSAQVSVEVSASQDQFLEGESIPITVRIKNRSGQKLHFGADNEWLSFSVESRDGFVVIKNADVPVKGEFDLESSQVATKRVDLSPYFVLPRQGRYSVTATVHLADWGSQVNSQPKSFDVIEAARLWAQEFGVPLPEGASNRAPEIRKYILEQANYLRSQLRLYMRLTDASESRIFKVVQIGPMVSFGHPEQQIDRLSRLHVLYQNGPRTYSYQVFDSDGEMRVRQSYFIGSSRPRLRVDDGGNIYVYGGVRRPTSTDIPAPNLSSNVQP